MSNPISRPCGPFPNQDTFTYCRTKYLGVSDIGRTAQVCKLWNLWSPGDQNLWKTLSEREGVPLVRGERDYLEDFKILYPITISSAIIGQFLGRVIEQVPPISEECFNELKQPDPFERSKLKMENYVFIVVPTFITRTVDKETPLALDDSGDLVETSEPEERELEIPFSLTNIRMLCSYPLKGKENMPVFSERSHHDAFERLRCISSSKITVYFMRKHIAEQISGKPYLHQVKLLRKVRFGVTSLKNRVLYNALAILKNGTCPDGVDPLTYARSSDTVHYGNNVRQSVVGNFAPGVGMEVDLRNPLSSCDFLGVAPGRVVGFFSDRAIS